MVLVGLLVIALFCLAIGLVLANSAWLIASLIASAGAAVLLYRTNQAMKRRAGRGSGATSAQPDRPAGSAHAPGSAQAAESARPPRAVAPAQRGAADAGADTEPTAPAGPTPVTTAMTAPVGNPAAPAGPALPGEHLPPSTPLLDDTAGLGTAAPADPRQGITPEIGTEPDSVGQTPGRPPAAAPGDVWVIDGRPRYHLHDCPIIKGQDAEPIPFPQAVGDGFMPCSLCEPNAARSTG